MYMLDTNICIYMIKKKMERISGLIISSLKYDMGCKQHKEFERISGLRIEHWV